MDMYKLYSDMCCVPCPSSKAVIDVSALAENYRRLCELMRRGGQNAEPVCVVKSDAYGHSCEICAPVLAKEGCRRFAVATVAEALTLRKILEKNKCFGCVILILGYTPPADAPLLEKYRITQTVFSAEYARELSAYVQEGIGIHIKLDTGMGRLGFLARNDADIESAVREIISVMQQKKLKTEGIFTHFYTSDDADRADETREQFRLFDTVCKRLADEGFNCGFRHVCNSAGCLGFPEFVCDGVRIGIALYGAGVKLDGIRPVMSFECTVSHVKTLRKGESLGYGGEFTADRDMKVATLTVGYADGFRRSYGGAYVKIKTANGDAEAKIIGRVCMDQCMADIGDAQVCVGDRVVIFGDTRERLESLAARAQTIDYECLCSVSSRVPRVIKDE